MNTGAAERWESLGDMTAIAGKHRWDPWEIGVTPTTSVAGYRWDRGER